MAMTKRTERQFTNEFINIEEMIPQDHFLRVIEKHFDWNFVYEEVEKMYSKYGRKSIDPVVLVKIHILKFLFNEDSLRKTYEALQYNILYKWFIGYELGEKVPDHSTYSQNYKRKFCKLEKDLLQTVFDKVIDLLLEQNCLDMTNVYIDSTNTKAYANKKKNHKEMMKIEVKKYQRDLDMEIAIRQLDSEDLTEEEFLEEVEKIIKCNEEVETEEVIRKKEVIKSDTDKDAGMLYKNEKEKMFGYNSTVICDNNNYALTVDVNPSNMHDSVAFYPAFEKLINKFGVDDIVNFLGDAAYKTPHICKTLLDLELTPLFPYKRPMTKEGYFKKYEYIYDDHNDIYICPNEKDLIPTSINKDGYIKYKADQNDCENCAFKDKCTKMKSKEILRHVWEGYKEMVEELRYDLKNQEEYKKRPSHIERLYADGKMKFGLGKTYFRGKERVSRELTLLYACMNLKKFAIHHYA